MPFLTLMLRGGDGGVAVERGSMLHFHWKVRRRLNVQRRNQHGLERSGCRMFAPSERVSIQQQPQGRACGITE